MTDAWATCCECEADLDNGFCHQCDALRECCFPDCGCDGARLCDAEGGASERANGQNVEGMWQRKDDEAKIAVFSLVGSIAAEKGENND